MADSNVHPSNPASVDLPEGIEGWSPEKLTSEWDQLEKELEDAANAAHSVKGVKVSHGEPSEAHEVYAQVMAKVTKVRSYWRGIGEVTGTRTFIDVQNNTDQ